MQARHKERRFGNGVVLAVAALAVLLGLASSATAQTAPGDGNPGPRSITGIVVDGDGPVDDIDVDLFSGFRDGRRVQWLGSTRTGADEPGTFQINTESFDNDQECWILTFIADGRTFGNGTRWENHTVCPEDGDAVELRIVLAGGQSVPNDVSGLVVDGATGLAGVQVDLFNASADGRRMGWRGSALTDSAGNFSFELAQGCYVLTYVAPVDTVFEKSNTQWLNYPVCVDEGDRVIAPTVSVVNTEGQAASLAGSVVENGTGASGIVVDLFTASDNGQRLDYVRSSETDSDGSVSFTVEPGCYVLTFIAPEPKLFAFGALVSNEFECVTAGARHRFEAVDLLPPDNVAQITVSKYGLAAASRIVELYEIDDQNVRGSWSARFETTTFPTSFLLGGSTGCWLVVLNADPGETFAASGAQTQSETFCEDDLVLVSERRQRVMDVEGEILPDGPPTPVDVSDGQTQAIQGTLDGTADLYRITAPANGLLAWYGEGCEGRQNISIDLFVILSDGSTGAQLSVTCGRISYLQAPADGVLTVAVTRQFRPVEVDYNLRVRVAETRIQQVDLANESTQVIADTIAQPGDRIVYVIDAVPGNRLVIDSSANDAATCQALNSRLIDSVSERPYLLGGCVSDEPQIVPTDGFTFVVWASESVPFTFTLNSLAP